MFGNSRVSEDAALVVEVDGVDDPGGGDQCHTFADLEAAADRDGTDAEVGVAAVAVAERLAPRLPAAAGGAAVEGADGVEKLVAGVLLPVRRFAPPGHYHARPQDL